MVGLETWMTEFSRLQEADSQLLALKRMRISSHSSLSSSASSSRPFTRSSEQSRLIEDRRAERTTETSPKSSLTNSDLRTGILETLFDCPKEKLRLSPSTSFKSPIWPSIL